MFVIFSSEVLGVIVFIVVAVVLVALHTALGWASDNAVVLIVIGVVINLVLFLVVSIIEAKENEHRGKKGKIWSFVGELCAAIPRTILTVQFMEAISQIYTGKLGDSIGRTIGAIFYFFVFSLPTVVGWWLKGVCNGEVESNVTIDILTGLVYFVILLWIRSS